MDYRKYLQICVNCSIKSIICNPGKLWECLSKSLKLREWNLAVPSHFTKITVHKLGNLYLRCVRRYRWFQGGPIIDIPILVPARTCENFLWTCCLDMILQFQRCLQSEIWIFKSYLSEFRV